MTRLKVMAKGGGPDAVLLSIPIPDRLAHWLYDFGLRWKGWR